MIHKKGFIVFLIPLTTLFITGFMGITVMSLGIKNTTSLQSLCFKNTIEVQEKLKAQLVSLLSLNKEISSLHSKEQKIRSYLLLAHSAPVGIAPTATLEALLYSIKLKQKILQSKQIKIFLTSKKIKTEMFQKFSKQMKELKAKSIQSRWLNKKPLAVFTKVLSEDSHLYYPVPEFSKHQALTFSWKASPFLDHEHWILKFLNLRLNTFSRYECIATLEKRREGWQTQLSHSI